MECNLSVFGQYVEQLFTAELVDWLAGCYLGVVGHWKSYEKGGNKEVINVVVFPSTEGG